MQATFWEKAGQTLVATQILTGMDRYSNEHLVQVTDGIEFFVIHPDDLKDNAKEIGDDLGLKELDHTIPMKVSQGDEQATLSMLDQMMVQCMMITNHGAVPFQLIDENQAGQVKEKRATLTDAVGFWRRATAFLDNTEEDGLIIRIVLHGVVFTDRIKQGETAMTEEELVEGYQVKPRFNNDTLETLTGNLGIDFDLVELGTLEFEPVDDEDDNLH